MDTPEQEFEARRFRSYARHFASLNGLIYDPQNRAQMERVFCIFRFVVSVLGQWFFVTIGHVFRKIEEAKQQGQVIEGWALDCSYSADAKDQFDTPFDLEGAEPKPEFSEESGLDYAFVPLRPLIHLNLKANGLTALDDQAWRRNLPTGFDEYFLLGIPAEFVSYDPKNGVINKVMVIAPMDKLKDIPEDIAHKKDLFFAQLHEIPEDAINVPTSIQGMSGGPIFGLKHGKNGPRYWAVAIQSWWEPQSRVIRACYLRDLCESLEKRLQQQATR